MLVCFACKYLWTSDTSDSLMGDYMKLTYENIVFLCAVIKIPADTVLSVV